MGEPKDPPPYGDSQCGPVYWDARHNAGGDEPFDWYFDYDRLRPLLHEVLPNVQKEPEVLDLGCGTSEVPARLWRDGWRNVVGIDTSVVAITQQNSQKKRRTPD